MLLALALRLLVWRWHELYPLGGDEREYLDQALALLRERRYVELRLMRPPLYTGFLAACIYLLDSLVQRLRLVQAVISALTVLPIYALTIALLRDRRAAMAAALLAALSYTLAANATELLTETLFLFGLATFLWLLVKAGGWGPGNEERGTRNEERGTRNEDRGPRTEDRGPRTDGRGRENKGAMPRARAIYAALGGVTLGLLALLRSVALPLLPLAMLWLWFRRQEAGDRRYLARATSPVYLLPFAFCLVVLPWTARNYLAYGALIVVDTTGAENLWLDNDPAGREAVKAQLYALGDDRAARQRLAMRRGLEAIAGDPARFLAKAWGEAQKFVALQFFDDMRARRAIWVPPHEVWLRLVLGDGVWLILLFGGVVGLWLAPECTMQHETNRRASRLHTLHDARWLLVPWVLYVFLTALVFHVELRYRLPLYPALLPYAGWTLARIADWRGFKSKIHAPGFNGGHHVEANPTSKLLPAALTCLALGALLLLHHPYPAEAWTLAWKHAHLLRADHALEAGDPAGARTAAGQALARDPHSALASVALARAALLEGDRTGALAALDAAVAAVPDHPRAHVLRGAVLRAQGREGAARADLAYETASLEDLQRWAWDVLAPWQPPPAALDVGGGLDLGFLRGFHPAGPAGARWTRAEAEVRLSAPHPPVMLELRLASGRPAGAPPPDVTVLLDGREIGGIRPARELQTYRISVPPGALTPGEPAVVTLRSGTFRPRDLDRASPDARELGVMVDWIGFVTP
ncbi:MAG TPA: tetratricopeptide repeat protein [Roseiflexaceae bacterium]|nr:tetratricopeptide repeat protein [Roseiflexaceae bacterium]